MLLIVVGVIIVAGLAYWVVVGSRQRSKPVPRDGKSGARFGAVEIRLRSGSCDAAHALEGQRFLAKDAPALPLQNCTAAKCSCGFGKLSDRRTESRRFEHGDSTVSMFMTRNRRNKRDRRKER